MANTIKYRGQLYKRVDEEATVATEVKKLGKQLSFQASAATHLHKNVSNIAARVDSFTKVLTKASQILNEGNFYKGKDVYNDAVVEFSFIKHAVSQLQIALSNIDSNLSKYGNQFSTLLSKI